MIRGGRSIPIRVVLVLVLVVVVSNSMDSFKAVVFRENVFDGGRRGR
jgi:hypothetical protein